MKRRRRYRVLLFLFASVFTWWLFCLPRQLFNDPLATIVLDREGQLLSATIAADGQWRIPAADTLSPRLAAAVLAYEDQRFYRHWGVDFKAMARAMRQNWRAKTIISGGSTISMQVIRLAKKNPPRTIRQKLLEVFRAWRLEWRYSKSAILKLWCDNAPFGGNVVGAEAAAWRYYGRAATDLSWAEAATLAVLPNSPALIHPGRSRDALLAKRNRLLDRLKDNGQITNLDWELALAEPLPGAPLPLPRRAPHLLNRLNKIYGAGRHQSSIDGRLQAAVNQLIAEHHKELMGNQIANLAAMVIEVNTARVLAYVGNVKGLAAEHSPAVDLITAPRSPGSLLKPMLYGLALSEGLITPRQLLLDIPANFRGFNPANFNNRFSGAVAADQALERSLNIPFVYLLRDYGIPKYHSALRHYGFSYLNQPAEHYGLSLVLGGGEVSMEQISSWFLGLSRQQKFYYLRQGQYAPDDWLAPSLLLQEHRSPSANLQQQAGPINAGAGYSVLQALRRLERPNREGDWQSFSSSRPIAWKTGTSFGFRDAWAVGTNPDYVVAVWAGNADGEGRPGLIGVQAAGPLLFDIYRLLPPPTEQQWYEAPYDDLQLLATCKTSGFLASQDCPVDTSWAPIYTDRAQLCTFHQRILLSEDANWRVHQDCLPSHSKKYTSWFSLPPAQAHFYQREHPDYQALPAWHPSCNSNAGQANTQPMQLIYPTGSGKIKLGRDWNGESTAIIFEAAHQEKDKQIYWHLDDQYLGTTRQFHKYPLQPDAGRHQLTLVDEDGHRLVHYFQIEGD